MCRSEEWKKIPAKEREKMDLKIDDDGDFWWAPQHAPYTISHTHTIHTLRLLCTNFSVFALRVLAYTNFSDFLCAHNVIMNSTKVQNPRQNSYAGTGCRHYTMHCLTFEQQVPRTTHIRYIHYTRLYILRMRVRVPRSRVGPRLYFACFTPVAPVASL